MLLAEYSNYAINLSQAIEMLLIHDLIEVYAGDTFCYDQSESKTKHQRKYESSE